MTNSAPFASDPQHRSSDPTPAHPTGEWWRSAVIYQIYPKSFADSDGDGIGDLAGISSRLDYLKNLGVDAVWISPFYPSPQADGGYDVEDYTDVDPQFGTLADIRELIPRAHQLGLKIIVDVVPNHTSTQHAWFQRALAAPPGSPERDWYIFRDIDPDHPDTPPNNWPSEFGGPAWSKTPPGSAGEQQWYLHLFDSSQPDLNWDNPAVRHEFLRILSFWLDLGVDGFRVDVAHGLAKAPGLPDAPWNREELKADDVPTHAAPYWDQDGVHEIYRSWRALLNTYPGQRMMVAEAWVHPADRLARYIRADEHQQAFNLEFLGSAWSAEDFRTRIRASLLANEAVGAPTTWVLSNHDVIRTATRLALAPSEFAIQLDAPVTAPDAQIGQRRARAAAMLMLALPGSAYLYQGEELGLPEVLDIAPADRQDPTYFRTAGARLGRDGCRVPIPWSAAGPNFGFTAAQGAEESAAEVPAAGEQAAPRPWLAQPEWFADFAVDAQAQDPTSTLNLYAYLLRLRREYGLGEGALRIAAAGDTPRPDLLIIEVYAAAHLRCIVNFGSTPWTLTQDSIPHQQIAAASEPLVNNELAPDCAVWLLI